MFSLRLATSLRWWFRAEDAKTRKEREARKEKDEEICR
jgi:hypothetical protein